MKRKMRSKAKTFATVFTRFASLELCKLDEECAMIVNMRVRPEFIRQGHGKKLVKSKVFEDTCSDFDSVFAFCDEKTVGFWRKMGEKTTSENAPFGVKSFIKTSNVPNLNLFKIK
jgi:hypothetical protein